MEKFVKFASVKAVLLKWKQNANQRARKVVIEKPCDKQEDETTEEQVEVHGADGKTIVITQ